MRALLVLGARRWNGRSSISTRVTWPRHRLCAGPRRVQRADDAAVERASSGRTRTLGRCSVVGADQPERRIKISDAPCLVRRSTARCASRERRSMLVAIGAGRCGRSWPTCCGWGRGCGRGERRALGVGAAEYCDSDAAPRSSVPRRGRAGVSSRLTRALPRTRGSISRRRTAIIDREGHALRHRDMSPSNHDGSAGVRGDARREFTGESSADQHRAATSARALTESPVDHDDEQVRPHRSSSPHDGGCRLAMRTRPGSQRNHATATRGVAPNRAASTCPTTPATSSPSLRTFGRAKRVGRGRSASPMTTPITTEPTISSTRSTVPASELRSVAWRTRHCSTT